MLNNLIIDLGKMIDNLEEVLNMKKTELVRDSAIKRFEICFDLAWKAIKEYARRENIECYSPRQCFKEAYQLKLIDYDEAWIDMLADRNLCTHAYKLEYADKIYNKLNDYLAMFKELSSNLKK